MGAVQPQNGEQIDLCRLSHLVYGILLGEPEETSALRNTNIYSVIIHILLFEFTFGNKITITKI